MHLDLNKDFSFNLEQKDIFTIICGDISENVSEICKWIKNNISSGVFVEGNHIGYQNSKPIQEILENLSTDFPLNNNISHLNNSYKIIEDKLFKKDYIFRQMLVIQRKTYSPAVWNFSVFSTT